MGISPYSGKRSERSRLLKISQPVQSGSGVPARFVWEKTVQVFSVPASRGLLLMGRAQAASGVTAGLEGPRQASGHTRGCLLTGCDGSRSLERQQSTPSPHLHSFPSAPGIAGRCLLPSGISAHACGIRHGSELTYKWHGSDKGTWMGALLAGRSVGTTPPPQQGLWEQHPRIRTPAHR